MKEEGQTFPKYQSPQGIRIKFQKSSTVREVFEEAVKSKIEEYFSRYFETQFKRHIFIFKLKYNQRQWNIRKTFAELYNLQHVLSKKYRNIPQFPLNKGEQQKLSPKLLTVFHQFLRCFVRTVYQNALKDVVVIQFFSIFPQRLGNGVIYGQFQLKKRSGGRYNQTSCIKEVYHCLLPCSKNWRYRYFTVTDTGVFYSSRPKSFEIKDMLLYCFKFNIECGMFKTGRQLGIVIQSDNRRLKLESYQLHTLVIFVAAIHEALYNSPFSPQTRKINQKYGSFAPIRSGCTSKFYIDGKDYFEDMYKQLKKAKKHVYMTGWMITPFFMLKRPNQLINRQYRLDGVLQQLAARNVKIYIIVYQQPKIAINNDSEFVLKYFEEIGNNNIRVVRHPNYLLIPFLWSHHQKIVVIDQQVAFLGGLDICYGRWDTPEHHLHNHEKHNYWQGADFCNLRIRDIYKPRDFMMSNLTNRQPKMPWHDIAIQIRGHSVQDIARHFTSYWNFVNFQIRIDNDRQLLNLAGLKQHPKQSKLAAAKNFFKNFTLKKKTAKVEPMIEMTIDTTRQTNEEKKENVIQMLSESRRKQSIQQEFYEKYFEVEQSKFSNIDYIKQKIMKYPSKIIQMFKEPANQQQILYMINQEDLEHGRHKHLLLRSSSTWSGGLQQLQSSIHTAYLDLIKNARSFIYIQNQFFIARENGIVDQLAQRILRAYRKKEVFKVVVFIPLLPGFQGDVRQNNSTVMRIQLHLQYETICRSEKSLFKKLLKGNMKYEEIRNYIHFFSLRQHAVIMEEPVTQILYIHSKLMIVDDLKMIIGSANINDRSMLGDRDSEIAVLVEDEFPVCESKTAQSYSKEIRNFRTHLFMEHFAISRADAENFCQENIWVQLIHIAQRNTEIYRYIFGCYPDDKMKRLADITVFQKKTAEGKMIRYKQEKDSIRGHVVDLPLHFLEDEDLKIQLSQKEIILPDFFFT